jgi:hypothetical protein
MALPVKGKKYLVVFCKSKGCGKAFRVINEPLFEGTRHEIREPQTLTCRGCGAKAVYEPKEMRIAELGRNPNKRR